MFKSTVFLFFLAMLSSIDLAAMPIKYETGKCNQVQQGPPGPTGPTGPTGTAGTIGPTGPTGAPGSGATLQAYGEIYLNTTVLQPIAAGLTVPLFTWSNNGEFLNTTPDFTIGTITVAKAGLYLVSFNLSFTADPTLAFTFSIGVDGVSQADTFAQAGLSNSPTNVMLSALVRVPTSGAALNVRVSHTGGDLSIITGLAGNFNVVRIE